MGPGPTGLGPIKKIMKMDPIRLAMPPHGLIFGGNEAYGLQDAFESVPGPPGRQKQTKNTKKVGKHVNKLFFFRCSLPIISLKEANTSQEHCNMGAMAVLVKLVLMYLERIEDSLA